MEIARWPRPARWAGLSIALVFAGVLACASDGSPPHQNLTRAWSRYQELPESRALAIAGDPRGNRWVTGAAGGHASPADAEEAALVACRARRAARRLRAPCQIYAVGSVVVAPRR